jgi:hypothetical protein
MSDGIHAEPFDVPCIFIGRIGIQPARIPGKRQGSCSIRRAALLKRSPLCQNGHGATKAFLKIPLGVSLALDVWILKA